MARWLVVVGLLLASLLVGLPVRAEPGAAMLEDATRLVELGPRPAGRLGAHLGEQWLQMRLDAMGLTAERFVVGRRETPAIAVFGRPLLAPRTVDIPDATLLVTLPATEAAAGDADALLLLAHYDTVPASPGAIDNAAAVAVGLELLRRLAGAHRPRDVMVAFTACEETRLAGAHALAQGLQRSDRMPALALSLDLVGLRGGTLTLNGLSRKLGAPWLSMLHDAAGAAGVHLDAPVPHQVVSRVLPEIERSDHGVFSSRGVPAFHLYHRPAGRLYLDYHQPTDTIDRVDSARLAEVADFVTALATVPHRYPTEAGAGAVWLLGMVWPEWLMVAFELGLAAVVVVAFVRRPQVARSARELGLARTALIVLLAWGVAMLVELGIDTGLGHPAPWAHTPAAFMLHLVLVAALGARGLLMVPIVGRRPIGANGTRTLAGAATCAALGVLLLAVGVFELAWLPLLMGAGLALTLRPGVAWAGLGYGVAIVPALLVLTPGTVREASYNGFIPATLPIAAVLAFVTFPLALAAFDLAGRRWPPRSPRIATAALVVLTLGTALVALRSPPCSAEQFEREGLACERVRAGL